MPKPRTEKYDRDDITRAFALMVINPRFLKAFLPVLDAELFAQPELRWMTKRISEYVQENPNAALTFNILRSLLRNEKTLKDEEKDVIEPFLDEMTELRPRKIEVPYYTNVLEAFIRRCYVKGILNKAAEFLNNGETEEAEDLLLTMSIPSASREDVIFAPFDYDDLFKSESKAEKEKTIPTGIPGIDDVIDGLKPGEEGVVVAPLGYGKSMTLVAIGAHAWALGKNVFHFSFENSATETLARYVANMTGTPRHELLEDGPNGPAIERVVKKAEMQESVVVIERLIGSMTDIQTLEAAVINIVNQYEVEPDLIIIDYGDLMTPISASRQGHKYQDMQSVFSEIRDLASTLDVPIWTATQTNREGLKAKRVKTEHIADSLGKAMTADLILGLSRPKKDEISAEEVDVEVTGDTAEFRILKNRRGEEPKVPFKVTTNFALARFEECDVETTQDAKDEAVTNAWNKKRQERKKNAPKYEEEDND